jgi:hypothetical protein
MEEHYLIQLQLVQVELQVDHNHHQLQQLVRHKALLLFFQQLLLQEVVMEVLMEVLVMEQQEVLGVEQV